VIRAAAASACGLRRARVATMLRLGVFACLAVCLWLHSSCLLRCWPLRLGEGEGSSDHQNDESMKA